MAKRDLSLTPRVEDARALRQTSQPVQFSLEEIKMHFTDSMNSVKAQYEVADTLASAGKMNDCKTIWRSQVVLAEGLLDFYVHEMSKFCLYRMFIGRWKRSDKYMNFMIPMSKVEEAIAADDSQYWFFEYLNNRFCRDVFLSHESMKDQLNLIGIGFVDTMAKAFPRKNQIESSRYGAQVVRDLFQRRNDIAHQNDRSHASAQQRDISKEFVEEYTGKIEAIVNAINDIAVEREEQIDEMEQ